MSQIPPSPRPRPQNIPPGYPPPPPPRDEPLATIIPYRNGWALGSYYVGVFSAIPCLGAITGPVAVFLGIMGLRMAGRNPNSKGKAHAWVGIIAGAIFGLLYIALGIFILIGLINEASRHR